MEQWAIYIYYQLDVLKAVSVVAGVGGEAAWGQWVACALAVAVGSEGGEAIWGQ